MNNFLNLGSKLYNKILKLPIESCVELTRCWFVKKSHILSQYGFVQSIPNFKIIFEN